MPARTVSRRGTSKAPAAATPTPDEPATQVKTRLKASKTASSSKHKAETPSDPEIRRNAMQSINSTSQKLSKAIQEGWKPSCTSKSDFSSAEIYQLSKEAFSSISELRRISLDGMDVEKAAGSIVGKLISLEMFESAFNGLAGMQTSLLAALKLPSSSIKDPLQLLSLPLPTDIPATDSTTLILSATYLLHALVIISTSMERLAISEEALCDAFCSPNAVTLLEWLSIPHIRLIFPQQQFDSTLTRTYSALTKSTVLLKSSPTSLAALRIRIYTLKCLALTSSGIVKPDSFWGQSTKSIGVYAKSSTSKIGESEMCHRLLAFFSELADRAMRRDDRKEFMSGKAFLDFCDYWGTFAQCVHDVDTLTRIASFLNTRGENKTPDSKLSITDFHPSTPSLSTTETQQDLSILFAQAMHLLVEVATVMEKPVSSDESIVLDNLSKATKVCSDLNTPQWASSDISQDPQTLKKLDKSLDMLRRVSLKALEKDLKDRGRRDSILSLLDSLIRLIGDRFGSSVNLLTSVVETSFMLARSTLVLSDPTTYVPAYDFLDRAASLIACKSLPTGADVANYTRCISSAFHNIAGSFYQSGKYGPAVRFMRRSCDLGEQALEMRRLKEDKNDEQKSTSQQEGWRSLQQQILGRWELLGVCCSKIGDRHDAFTMFMRCIKAASYLEVDPNDAGSSGSLIMQRLSTIIDRVTYLGACDLLKPPKNISVRSIPGVERLEPAILGAILERQVASLEASAWKEGVPAIIHALLDDTLSVYNPDNMPIRRARVLLKSLEASYHSDGALYKAPEEIGEEIRLLLTRQSHGQDEPLTSNILLYRASACFWLALHAHKRSGERQTADIRSHVEAACIALQVHLSGPPIAIDNPPALKQEPVTKTTRKLPTRSGRTTPPKRASTRRAAPAAPSKTTTRSRSVKSAAAAASASNTQNVTADNEKTTPARSSQASPQSKVDNSDKFLVLAHMVTDLLGLVGLIVLKVQLLDLICRLCEEPLMSSPDGYVNSSIDLGNEYIRLGKFSKASAVFGQALHKVRTEKVSPPVRARFLLRYAESLTLVSNSDKSVTTYSEAVLLSDAVTDNDKSMPTSERIRARANRLEHAALACRAHSAICYSNGDMVVALEGMLQSLRLWNRAVDTLARLRFSANPTPAPAPTLEDPFAMQSMKEALHSVETQQVSETGGDSKARNTSRKQIDGLEWRIVDGLLSTLFSLGHAYLIRGSPREAEYFIQQAQDVAQSYNAQAMVSRALSRKGEIQLHQGLLEEGYNSIVQAAELLQDTLGVDAADVERLRGDYNHLSEKEDDAGNLYIKATAILEELNKIFISFDADSTEPKTSTGLSPKHPSADNQAYIAPTVLSAILRQHIWLLRDQPGEAYDALVQRFTSLPTTAETELEDNLLVAKLSLYDAQGRLKSDISYNSIAETTIALPAGMTSSKPPSITPSMQEIIATLGEAESVFWGVLGPTNQRGKISDVRTAAVSLALIQALQGPLGLADNESAILATNLLDLSTSTTLRRELLESIHHKFPDTKVIDESKWPTITTETGEAATTPKPPAMGKRGPRDSLSDGESDDDENIEGDASLKKYWESRRIKYASSYLDVETLSVSRADRLPPNWVVINMSVTDDKSSLLVSRQRAGHTPLVFCVPLRDRREDGDTEEGEQLTFDGALEEFKEIIRLSHLGTQQASRVKNNDLQARAAWWAERAALDKRLKELLSEIEFCWLGAFKTILSQPRNVPSEALAHYRKGIENVFKRALHSQERKSKAKVKLADEHLECFSALHADCRDEELEDLVYFILDLYQSNGVPVDIAEVDVTVLVVELRMVLEEHAVKYQASILPVEDSHIFLVLDKNIQGLPWESIPTLRGCSVSRIPSIDFLMDRLDLETVRHPIENPDRAKIDAKKTFYCLNPSGDLKGTEGRFAPWLKEMETVGWTGVVGRPPTERQLLDALEKSDLVIYFGHGGAEQYVRSHKIRHLKRCAATMLYGCSSGYLREMGDFDRVGTPYNYMLAGCPTLVANLWDVTDRDIDKFSQSVFDQIRLSSADVHSCKDGNSKTSVVTAISKAREVCKLKYLTGAAPIVYGIPFYL